MVYAGALDVAVGPRWYSTYEMACNVVKIFLEKAAVSAIPYGGVTKAEEEILADHVAHCVEHAIASGNKGEQRRKVGELIDVLSRSDR